MKIYPFFIPHEGCPYRCLFCDQKGASGHGSSPSPSEVALVLDRILPPRGDGEVAFYGGTFTLLSPGLRDGYLEAVSGGLRDGRISGIRISTRPDALEGNIVEILREKGVATVELGCQSFSHEVLRAVGRGHGPECISSAVETLKKSGIRVGLQLIPGLPGGDRQEAIDSVEKALALAPDFLRIYPAVVFRGTGLEELYRAGGYRPPEIGEAVLWCADLLLRCRRAGVPVIRMGLQGTRDMDSGRLVAAGAYHPAFGQLVRSRLWLQALSRTCREEPAVRVHPSDLSDALGHRRTNLTQIRCEREDFSIVSDPAVERGCLAWGGRVAPVTELAEFA